MSEQKKSFIESAKELRDYLNSEEYRKYKPEAAFIRWESKNGHFKIPEFPEIIMMLKEDLKRI